MRKPVNKLERRASLGQSLMVVQLQNYKFQKMNWFIMTSLSSPSMPSESRPWNSSSQHGMISRSVTATDYYGGRCWCPSYWEFNYKIWPFPSDISFCKKQVLLQLISMSTDMVWSSWVLAVDTQSGWTHRLLMQAHPQNVCLGTTPNQRLENLAYCSSLQTESRVAETSMHPPASELRVGRAEGSNSVWKNQPWPGRR